MAVKIEIQVDRHGKREVKKMAGSKAIRWKCQDCCAFQAKDIMLCTCVDCSLHPYRMGGETKTDKTNKKLGMNVPYKYIKSSNEPDSILD